MSMPNRTETINNLCDFASEHYKLGGACVVIRDVDISSQYVNRHTLHVTKHGIEVPDADVIIHLEPGPSHSGTEIRFLYLWDNKIWNSEANFDMWKDDTGIIVLSFMGDLNEYVYAESG